MNDYNNFAGQFSQTREYLWDDIKHLLKYIKENDKVLDIGCGNGRLYHVLKEKQAWYTGLDLSEELIKIATAAAGPRLMAVAKTKYPEASFVVGDMKKLLFLTDTFDTVFCIAAFHHLATAEERLQALREMKRVVKPGGKILLVNWNLLGQWGIGKVEKGDFKRFGNDFSVPWRNSERKVLGERFYHAFTLDEIELLCKEVRLRVEQNLYSKKGSESDRENGENIITVLSY